MKRENKTVALLLLVRRDQTLLLCPSVRVAPVAPRQFPQNLSISATAKRRCVVGG